MRRQGRLNVLTLAVAVLAAGAPSFGDDEEVLNRSFYVPVEIEPCDHLSDALLYRDDAPIARLPGQHVFQFTFYPSLKRIEPELERVRVEGTHEGEPFRTELIVTPFSVYVGSKKIDLDTEELMGRLRRRIDTRHASVEIALTCGHACRRGADSGTH